MGVLLRAQGSALLCFGAHVQNEYTLINYRTARAGSGAPHVVKAYIRENEHCTSDTKHTGLLRAIL